MDKNQSPKIYGVLGYPASHSLSPKMHNAAFRALGINAEYRLFEVKPQELENFLLRPIPVKDIDNWLVSKADIFGFNITIPHKVRAKEILEKKFPIDDTEALLLEDQYYVKLSGAVNTVKKGIDKLYYYNTDASGFLRSLEKGLKFNTKGKNVLIIGCGGAGRALIASLSWKESGIKKVYINDMR